MKVDVEEDWKKILSLPPEEKAQYIFELRRRGYTYDQIAKILKVNLEDIPRLLGAFEDIEFLHSGILSPIKRWGTKWSLWPVHLVTACCGVELAHTYACGYDAERIGSLNYGIARQTNLIVVEGAITRKMAKVLRITWEQMPEPKFVIVMGACGLEGGLFWNSYHIVKPSDVVPVDFFIPGCPPTPEALIRAIRLLQEKIKEGEVKPSVEYEEADLKKVLEIPETIKPRKPPKVPFKISDEPLIKIDVEKEVDWGKKLVEEIKRDLDGLYQSVVVTDINRICLKAKPDRLPAIANKIKDKFDHVKSVNVVDIPHENKFIVEYVVSSYSIKELMPVLLTLATEVPRDHANLPSLAVYWPSADYLEREMQDLFGVVFEGNPWKYNFLLSPEVKHPLRKDFKLAGNVYVLEGE